MASKRLSPELAAAEALAGPLSRDFETALAEIEPRGLGPEGPSWQQRKSAQTRVSILEAAIDCLASRGYARTTTQMIAEMADVSRGAMLHHYPTKDALIEAIVAYSFYKRLQMLAEGVGRISEMQRVRDFAGLEVLWRSFFSREYRAFLELSIAARTNPDLKEIFLPQARRFGAVWRREGLRIFPEWGDRPTRFAQASDLVEALLEGLALNVEDWGDAGRVKNVRALLPKVVGMIFSGALAQDPASAESETA